MAVATVAAGAASVAAAAVGLRCFRTWMQGGVCTSTRSLKGKVVVVTGANTGIGKECAKDFCRRGGKVVMLCRSRERAEAAAEEVRAEGDGEVVVEIVDLSSLRSVRECAERLKKSLEKVDILLNNAGVLALPLTRTEDGLEATMGTNHFGHFLLTNLLLPLLYKAGPSARVVNVSSILHTKAGRMNLEDINYTKDPAAYGSVMAYNQSKLANVLFTRELAVREPRIHAYALHPGVIATDIARHMGDSYGKVVGRFLDWIVAPLVKTVKSGAQTSIYCCVAEEVAEHTGRYYVDCREEMPCPAALDAKDAQRLWELSEQLTGLRSSFTESVQYQREQLEGRN